MNMEQIQIEVEELQPEDFVGNQEDIAVKCLELLKSIYNFSKEQEKNSPSLTSGIRRRSLKPKKKGKSIKQVLSCTEAPLDDLIVEDFDNEQIWEEIQLQNNFMHDHLVTSVSKLLAHQRHTTITQTPKSDYTENEGAVDEDEDAVDEDEDTVDEDAVDEDEDKQNLKTIEEPSNFEKRRRKIEENIEMIEEDALKPKEWKFQGEVAAKSRPENSLLEEHLMFDHLIRQAPEITTETTLRLEDIIKQRVKDQAWDDVERKIKPIEGPSDFKKKLVLDAEKSKMSLSEIYEQEYIKKKRADEGEQPEEQIPEEQLQIQKDMQSLFAKLDALSNFHYTPRLPNVEVKVTTNLPSIAIEEVAPVNVSDATLLAPQEIQSKEKGEIKSKAERSDTDRKRERRQKKMKQKMKRLAKEEKDRQKGLGSGNIKFVKDISNKKNKSGKIKKSSKGSTLGDESYENSKVLKSSKAFFAKLSQQS